MKIIFLQDIPRVAKAGEIRAVADGYARNYLIPQKMAVLANIGTTKMVELQKQIEERKQKQLETEMKGLAQKLEGMEVVLKAKAGEQDRLYGSITTADVAAELQKKAGVEVDKRKIEMPEAIHQLGTYDVPVRLGKDIMPTVKVTVTPIEESTDSASGQATPA